MPMASPSRQQAAKTRRDAEVSNQRATSGGSVDSIFVADAASCARPGQRFAKKNAAGQNATSQIPCDRLRVTVGPATAPFPSTFLGESKTRQQTQPVCGLCWEGPGGCLASSQPTPRGQSVSLSFARRGQVAFAGQPALVPGHGVVQVASGGGTAATGGGAPGITHLDQVLEFPAGFIPRFSAFVAAGATGDWRHLDAQAADPVLRAGAGRRVGSGDEAGVVARLLVPGGGRRPGD
jgi:hypothetical protein